MTSKLLAGLLALASIALSDDWVPAQIREVFCRSRHYWVRITPGKSLGDTFGFKSAPKGPYATAELYEERPDRSYVPVYSITLLNPIAPVDFFVTNRGFLITLDNWHNMGYGAIACFYSPTGKLIRSYKLGDLFDKAEIQGTRTSVSSIWWRTPPTYIREEERSLYVATDDHGGSAIFETETGKFQLCENRKEQFVCRDSNEHRQWRPFHEPGQ